MPDRPYTLLSCSMSIDGYIDGASESRLMLSNEQDFDRVDEVRAGVDAILVGATTVRNDNPRLQVRDPGRRRARVAHGFPEQPTKVTITGRGRLDRDPCARRRVEGEPVSADRHDPPLGAHVVGDLHQSAGPQPQLPEPEPCGGFDVHPHDPCDGSRPAGSQLHASTLTKGCLAS